MPATCSGKKGSNKTYWFWVPSYLVLLIHITLIIRTFVTGSVRGYAKGVIHRSISYVISCTVPSTFTHAIPRPIPRSICGALYHAISCEFEYGRQWPGRWNGCQQPERWVGGQCPGRPKMMTSKTRTRTRMTHWKGGWMGSVPTEISLADWTAGYDGDQVNCKSSLTFLRGTYNIKSFGLKIIQIQKAWESLKKGVFGHISAPWS